jgi:hypothetical protein
MPTQRFKSLLDVVADRLGYAPKSAVESLLKLEGHVYVTAGEGPEVYLGQNVITEKMRVNAAGLLARTAADPWAVGPPAYLGDTGYTSGDQVFPTYLAVGTGTRPAATTDTDMDSPLLVAGSIQYYPVQSVRFHNTPGGYPAGIPISVSYYFNIPAGELYDTPSGPTTDIDFQEWALFGENPTPGASLSPPPADNDMLARKVARVSKISALDLTVRWELRT